MFRQSIWTISLGRWGSVHISLHFFFILFALLVIYQAALEEMLSTAAVSLIVLLTSVLLHELAHYWAANRAGVMVDQIVLGPWGGLEPIPMAHIPRREMTVALAGPLLHLVVCTLLTPVIVMLHGNLIGLLNPVNPQGMTGALTFTNLLALTFWINWVLLLVNSIPAFPMDGGRFLTAAILVFSPSLDNRSAVMFVATIAKAAALCLVVTAVFTYEPQQPAGLVSSWFALVLMGVFLFFGAKHEMNRVLTEEQENDQFQYDFVDKYSSYDNFDAPEPLPPKPGLFIRWLRKRREVRNLQRQSQEAEEELQMDKVLSKLHSNGINGLSRDERALLKRVSARYRSRQNS